MGVKDFYDVVESGVFGFYGGGSGIFKVYGVFGYCDVVV